jgi:uncharacterized protein YdeI (YjbR/CyaY-like superfamily)
LRDWFSSHAGDAKELWVGFYKKGVDRKGVSYAEALGEGICFGWIDVLQRRFDDISYMLRFVPRKMGGNWTPANVALAEKLIAEGRMRPPGLAAFESRKRT